MRKAALEAEGKFFDEHQAEFDELYTKLIENRNAQARAMGYENYVPLSYLRMQRLGYGRKEVETYREQVVRDVVPLIARMKARQAARCGLTDPKLYDAALYFADGNPTPTGTPEEILASGRKMYRELSPETAEFIDFMMDNELLDVLSRPGKAPGGYCTALPDLNAPFIFSNFNGTSGDVDVLTHEAGHAFQAYRAFLQDLPGELQSPGMESCEIHSMSMEFLTTPWHHLFFGEQIEMELKRECDFLFANTVRNFISICSSMNASNCSSLVTLPAGKAILKNSSLSSGSEKRRILVISNSNSGLMLANSSSLTERIAARCSGFL